MNTGDLTSIADLAKYELANNPDGTDYVSNPYALVIDGDTAYVADAGANDIFSLKLDGSVKVTPLPKQTIENPELPPSQSGQVPDKLEIQSVPTGVAVDLDGATYVSELTAFPFPEGRARILRIGDDGKADVYLDGFTQIADLQFDRDGNLLILQFGDRAQWKGDLQHLPGSSIQVAPDGTRTTLVAAGEGLESATALDIGPDAKVYITNRGASSGKGQVVRIDRFDEAQTVP